MAWWGVDKGSEPLMHLERPSTGSSQTTAHVILACFNDVLAEKSLDSKDINNLSISNILESGSTLEFRKYYVDRLKGISDDYNEQLEELSKVECHLLEAKAKALEEDEQYLEQLSKRCPDYKDTQFPHRKSLMSQFLDEQLLEQHDLLLPSKFLERPVSPRLPPRSTDHSQYLKSTETSRQHACEVPERAFHLPPIHTSQPLQGRKGDKDYWKNYLSVPNRLSEKSALAELTEKTAFSRNPKYSEGDVNNTASYGAVKIKRRSKDTFELNSLIVEPAQVLFTNYWPGETYLAQITVTNVSAVSRLVRLTHFDSPYFSISPGEFPCGDNMIAPGMHCTFTVTFRPDSLADFSELVQFAGSSGQYLKVALRGVRPAPILSIPSVLDCGGCLLENAKTCIFTCENSGGDGSFQVMPPADLSLNGEDKDQETESLALGSFVISPREFFISSGDSFDLMVVFSPHRTAHHTEDLVLACDNGSTATHTVIGLSEKVNIGCTRIRPSSSAEKLSFTSSPNPGEAVMIQATMLPDQLDCDAMDGIPTPSVEFPPVCPLDSSFQTIIIKNFSNVSLPFTWKYYRPIVSPSAFDEVVEEDEKPIIDNLEASSEQCPFKISPASGVLPPAKPTAFVARFNPDHLGDSIDMAYLTLTGGFKMDALELSEENVGWLQLSESCVSVVCIQLYGVAHPFQLEMIPPAWIIPGKILYATEFKRKLKVVNHSYSEVRLQWAGYSDDVVSVRVKPTNGMLGIGESDSFEVLTVANGEGPFHVTSWCSVDGSPTDIPFQVMGCIEGPIVDLSPGCLHFGLLSVGHSLAQKISITNTSNRIINYAFQQLVQARDDGFVDYECLSFFKPNEGKLLPRKSTTALVECTGLHAGKLRTTLQLLVNNSPHKCMFVEANVQMPSLCLESCKLHMVDAFVGIPSQHQIVLRNNTVIPTQYIWKAQVFGADGKHCRVDVKVMTGRLGPRESIDILLEITWTTKGEFEDVLLMCEVVGSDTPVLLALSANVRGLSVLYHLLQKPKHEETTSSVEDKSSSLHPSADHQPMPIPLHPDTGRPVLDYGSEVELRKPVTMTISITNESAIPTTLETYVTNFPCANQPTNNQSSNGRQKKVLLKRTQNSFSSATSSVDPGMFTASQYLSEGRGACFVVEPANTELQAFETIQLTVTAFTDMWGQYTDQLHCKVVGLEDYVIDIKMEVAGCPVYFQSTGYYGYTILRFGSHLAGSKTIKRIIKMKNDAPVDLQINWCVFNVVLEDNQLVDFVTYYGNSFQRTSSTASCIMLDEEEDSDKGSRLNDSGANEEVERKVTKERVEGQCDSARDKRELAEEEDKEREQKQQGEIAATDEGMENREEIGKERVEGRETSRLVNGKPKKCDEQVIVDETSGETKRRELEEQDMQTKRSGEDVMKEFDELSAQKDDEDGVEVGGPLVRKEAEWSFGNRSLKRQIKEESSSTEVSVEETPHILLKVHEGLPAKSPFMVSPKQLVIPSRGQATVVATFTPADDVTNTLGPTPYGYALGYMNIINEVQSSTHTQRVHGYAVNPIRIDMMTGIDKSELLMDCHEDDGLHFVVPASLLLNDDFEIQEWSSEVHHFTLTNTGTSIMSFKVITNSAHFYITLAQGTNHHELGSRTESSSSQSLITIKPQETIQFLMTYSFTVEDIRGKQSSSNSNDSLSYKDELRIEYSTGQIQKFPLSAIVNLPVLSLSRQEDCLGTCLVDSSNATSFVLSNSSVSSVALWTVNVSDENAVKVSPQSGRLMPYKNVDRLDIQTIQVLFTPRSEKEFSCCLLLKEELTQQTHSFSIKGIGSADEQYSL